ncbi:hypothetical protein [Cohnella cellulosilytica]|uniref:hypothetical protein n=1 Tax=Cohnella cellulosilytica TaxID=986710 RepID=UPI00360DAD52
MNLKPKGEVEIVLTTDLSSLRGNIERISEMIDQKVHVAMDSTVVSYNVQINARTEKPIKSYRVDEKGVHEVKPEGDQLEMDLDVAKRQEPIKDVPEEIGREVVDAFILSGLAPRPEGWYPIEDWVAQLSKGVTYQWLAEENGISSGRIIDLVDEYRRAVAPSAAAWDAWRKNKVEQPAGETEADEDDEDPGVLHEVGDEDLNDGVESDHDEEDAEELEDLDKEEETEDTLSDWERQVLGEDPQTPGASDKPADRADIETVILAERPVFEDIPYDFPTLLERRKGGETWMQIAGTLGIPSTKLSAAWSKYKKRVAEQQGGAA